jgi:hypothetical protein
VFLRGRKDFDQVVDLSRVAMNTRRWHTLHHCRACLPFLVFLINLNIAACYLPPLTIPGSMRIHTAFRSGALTMPIKHSPSFMKREMHPSNSEHRSHAVSSRSMVNSDAVAKEEGKSALVLSWFYAQPKEIELVKRIYKKRGFSTVIVVESLVKEAATPRGWYKSFLRLVLFRGAGSKSLREPSHTPP